MTISCSISLQDYNRMTQNNGLGVCMVGTYHGNGRVKLSNAHPTGRVLAMEALVRDKAAVSQLHCRLSSMGVQIDELLA